MNQEPGLELEVTWQPFELHADTPEEGIPVAEYFELPEERVEKMHEDLRQRAAELGLPFKSPVHLSNTRKAHILSEFARREGRLDALHRELFKANFVEGRNLGDEDVLRDVAARAGLDPVESIRSLEQPEYAQSLEQALARSQQLEITGVPAFIVEGKYMIVGAHPYEALRDTLRQIARGEV